MPKLKPTHIFVTDEEDATITAAAMSDPDALPYTEAEWAAAKPLLRLGGRPRLENPKVHTGLRLDADVLKVFKAGGRGWQTRINAVLREWIQTHPKV